MTAETPFPWEHRLVSLPPAIGGWTVEIWNPMTRAWQRGPNAPHWPAEYEDAAREWVRIENEAQRDRNRTSGVTA